MKSRFVLAIALSVGLAWASDTMAAKFCKDSAGNVPCTNGNGPCVCVDRNGTLVDGVNFTFDFADSANPDIELITADTGWIVWAQQDATDTNPHDIGDIKIKDTTTTGVFQVEIKNPDSASGAGAANLGSCLMTHASFTGASRIKRSIISGNLSGAIEAVGTTNPPTNGVVDIIIEGDVLSTATITML